MYQGIGRNIFQIAVERSSAQAVRQNDMLELKSPPSIATFSIPLKFYGFSHDRKARSIFLLKENESLSHVRATLWTGATRSCASHRIQLRSKTCCAIRDGKLWFVEAP